MIKITGNAWIIKSRVGAFAPGAQRTLHRLILSSAAVRTLFGKTRSQTPSSFLAEIPAKLIREKVPATETVMSPEPPRVSVEEAIWILCVF